MRQVLLQRPNIANVSANAKNVAPKATSVVIIAPSGCFSYPLFFEIDEGAESEHRDEIDPDDLTDYGYWHRHHPKKTWTPPGYGDDD